MNHVVGAQLETEDEVAHPVSAIEVGGRPDVAARPGRAGSAGRHAMGPGAAGANRVPPHSYPRSPPGNAMSRARRRSTARSFPLSGQHNVSISEFVFFIRYVVFARDLYPFIFDEFREKDVPRKCFVD